MHNDNNDYIDSDNDKNHNIPHHNKGCYRILIHNRRTSNTSYYGNIDYNAVIRLVGRYIIGIDITTARYHETISHGDIVITIENSTR